jgi:hypothetical protein
MAFEPLDDHCDRSIGLNSPKLVVLIRARPKIAMAIKRKPVRAPTGLHEGFQLAIYRPFENPVVGLVREEHISVSITRWAFSESKSAREFLNLGARSDNRDVIG